MEADENDQHVGLKSAWQFDRDIAEQTKKDVKPGKYEHLTGHALF